MNEVQKLGLSAFVSVFLSIALLIFGLLFFGVNGPGHEWITGAPTVSGNITLRLPENNTLILNVDHYLFNWSVNGTNATTKTVNLTIDGATHFSTNYTFNGTQENITHNVTGFAEGPHNWSVSLYNATASETSPTLLYVVDENATNITILGPANDTWLQYHANMTFNFTEADEFATNNCSLLINSAVNQTNATTANATNTTFSLTNLTTGQYNWSVNCSDTYNLSSASTVRLLTVTNYTVVKALPSIIFLPVNRTQTNVSAFRQNSTTGIFNLTAYANKTFYATANSIAGFTLKCAPNWNQTGLITLSTSPQAITTLAANASSMVWCFADFANTSGQARVNITVT